MSPMNQMDDWAEGLRRNAVVCEFARALFEARGRFHNTAFDMKEQPPHVRERYVALAHELLKKLEPADPGDALFNLAAGLARAAFRVVTPHGD